MCGMLLSPVREGVVSVPRLVAIVFYIWYVLSSFCLSSVDSVCHVNSVLLSIFPVPVSELYIIPQAI